MDNIRLSSLQRITEAQEGVGCPCTPHAQASRVEQIQMGFLGNRFVCICLDSPDQHARELAHEQKALSSPEAVREKGERKRERENRARRGSWKEEVKDICVLTILFPSPPVYSLFSLALYSP